MMFLFMEKQKLNENPTGKDYYDAVVLYILDRNL
jgi:hypothetical protein